jgi:S-layer protein
MATPNLGLTIPVGGTTPGAANNTTAGSYPFIIAADLNLIDSNCLSIPNNPAKVSNSGIVIDGNLPFGGFGITGASTASFSGAVGIGGLLTLSGAGTALTVTNNATVTGTLTVGTLALTNLSLSGTLGVTGLSTLAGISMSGNITSTAVSNWSINGPSGANIFINAATGEGVALQVNAGTVLSVSSTSVGISGVPLIQNSASTPLTLKGNSTALGGVGVSIDNATTQTSGSIVTFSTGGTSKASINSAGTFLSNPGLFTTGVTTTTATLKGTATAGNIMTQMDGTVDVTGTGYSCQFNSGGGSVVPEFAITGRGHLIPLSTSPSTSAGTFNAGFGTVTGVSVTGGDASFRINFTTGTATAITYGGGNPLVVITLNQAYSGAALAAAIAAYSSAPAVGGADQASLYAVFTSANQITLYSASGSAATSFTPQTTHAYSIVVHTMGAGASS